LKLRIICPHADFMFGPGCPEGVRLVQAGEMAGAAITLPAEAQRSAGLEILGQGTRTMPPIEVITGMLAEILDLLASKKVRVDVDRVPQSSVGEVWSRDVQGHRPSNHYHADAACSAAAGRAAHSVPPPGSAVIRDSPELNGTHITDRSSNSCYIRGVCPGLRRTIQSAEDGSAARRSRWLLFRQISLPKSRQPCRK
jgi:hypothetical protein